MKYQYYFSLIILSFSSFVFDAQAQKVEFKIEVLNKSQGVIEPLCIQWIATNKGNSFQAFSISTDKRRPQLQFKKLGFDNWISLKDSEIIPASRYKVTSHLSYQEEKTFLVSENFKVESEACYLPFYFEKINEPIFSNPGKYLIRLKVCPFYADSTCLYSSVDTITITTYTGIESAAFKWMQSKGITEFLFNPAIDGLLNEYSYLNERLPLANELIKKYGESSFGDWAKLYVASCNLNFYRNEKSKLIISKEFLQELISESNNPKLVKLAEDNLFYVKLALGELPD